MLTAERRQVSSRDHLDLVIRMEVEHDVNSNSRLVRALSILIHLTHGVPSGKGPAAVMHNLLLAPKSERTDLSSGETVARQCAMVGDSSNDEQWSDDLPLYQTKNFGDRGGPGIEKATNLNLTEDA